MYARFRMYGYQVGAGFHYLTYESLRLDNHQMGLEPRIRYCAQGPDRVRAEGDIRHELAVHYVKVQYFCAGRRTCARCFGKVAEVCRKQGWRDQYSQLALLSFHRHCAFFNGG